jgi:hypothetical protein
MREESIQSSLFNKVKEDHTARNVSSMVNRQHTTGQRLELPTILEAIK